MDYECLFCGNKLSEFMSFGQMPLASGFLLPDEFKNEYFYELKVGICDSCKLFQILEVPENARVFHPGYPHITSTSIYMVEHLGRLAQEVKHSYLKDNGFVFEIGSNDGSLLRNFVGTGIRSLGIDPAIISANMARKLSVQTQIGYFDEASAKSIRKEHGPADVIFAINSIAHIPNIKGVATGIKELIKEEGVLIFENVYLDDLIANTSYSQIYDEHVFTYSVESVRNIFSKYGLELFDIKRTEMQGGSMRFYLSPSGTHKINERVISQIEIEKERKTNDISSFIDFKKRCEMQNVGMTRMVNELKEGGKRICGYGAATKSTIMMNYCGLGKHQIDYLVDSTLSKQGMFSPGMHVPVRSPEYFRKNYPDFAIIFPWNHAAEIRDKERQYEQSGGKWIIPGDNPSILQN